MIVQSLLQIETKTLLIHGATVKMVSEILNYSM